MIKYLLSKYFVIACNTSIYTIFALKDILGIIERLVIIIEKCCNINSVVILYCHKLHAI